MLNVLRIKKEISRAVIFASLEFPPYEAYDKNAIVYRTSKLT